MPKITIVGYEDAEVLLGRAPDNFTHVISINDPGTPPPPSLKKHRARKLVLSFYDARSGPQAPTKPDVRKLLRFARGIQKVQPVLVHCALGASRSAAAALTIFASVEKPSRAGAQRAFHALLDTKPDVHPNAAIVGFADELLEYDGELLRVQTELFPKEVLDVIPLLDDLDDLMRKSGIDI